MKRILSLILVLCMVLSLMAGVTVTVFAEDTETIAITGVTAPTAGSTVTTEGITGAPQGSTLTAKWEVFSYAEGEMVDMEDTTFADNSVYRLRIDLETEDDTCFPEDKWYAFTVNGEEVDDWWFTDGIENGYQGFGVEKLYFVGNITFIDSVTIEELPAEEVGASADLSGIVLPEDAPYRLSSNTYWNCDDGEEIGSTLEADQQYRLETYFVPKAGYWFSADAELSAPREIDYFYIGTDGELNADFCYDLRSQVRQVEISLDMEFARGDSTAEVPVTIPVDANYTVSTAWDTEDETLGYGEYWLTLTVTPAEGYAFLDDPEVTINGQTQFEAENWYISSFGETEVEITVYVKIAPENGFVQNINLSGAPGDITAGEAITAPTLDVKRGNVTISKTEWVDAEYASVSGKFEDGKEYYLAVFLTPAEGYALLSGYYTEVERVDAGYDHPYQEAKHDGTAVFYIRYSLQPTVDAIEITVTEPVVGAAPAEPKVPDGAKYTIEYYDWYEYTEYGGMTNFEDGKGYYLDVIVIPAEGYEIGENVKVTINGREPYAYSRKTYEVSLSEKYSFMTQIDRVDITMPEPTLGGTGSVDSIRIPEDAKYSLDQDSTYWHGYNSEFTGTFEKDKYMLELHLIADEGCEFTEDTECYINGILWEVVYVYGNGSTAEVNYKVSFRDQINKVEIPALPTVAVGDEPTAPELEAPEGANYEIVFAEWTQTSGTMSFEDCTGPFRNGTVYYLLLQIQPNAGYEFSEDAVITIDGKEFSGVQILGDDYAIVAKMYTFGMKVINKVELTVDAPENGKAPGKLTAPEGAGYEVDDTEWSGGKDAEMFDSETLGKKDTFAYGNYYWVSGSIRTMEGYVLAEDAVITVNGQVVDLSELKEIFGFIPVMGDLAVVYYGFGQLTEPVQEPEPTPPADIPDTGDMSAVLWAVAGISSLLSLGAAAVTKKRG